MVAQAPRQQGHANEALPRAVEQLSRHLPPLLVLGPEDGRGKLAQLALRAVQFIACRTEQDHRNRNADEEELQSQNILLGGADDERALAVEGEPN